MSGGGLEGSSSCGGGKTSPIEAETVMEMLIVVVVCGGTFYVWRL